MSDLSETIGALVEALKTIDIRLEDTKEAIYSCMDENSHYYRSLYQKNEERLINLEVTLTDSIEAQQKGLQNVFDQFLLLEKRQNQLEEITKSDAVKEYLKLLPKAHVINYVLKELQEAPVAMIDAKIDNLIEDVHELKIKLTEFELNKLD